MTSTASTSEHSVSEETKQAVRELFSRFRSIYGQKFTSAYPDPNTAVAAMREWAQALNHLSAERIELAVGRCREEHAWMPSIAEFLELSRLRPSDLNLPDDHAALEHACQQLALPETQRQWLHPAIRQAAASIGTYRLMSESREQLLPAFKNAYRQAIEHPLESQSQDQQKVFQEEQISQWQDFYHQLLDQGLPKEQAAELSYYLNRPQGAMRQKLRLRSMKQAKVRGYSIQFPD